MREEHATGEKVTVGKAGQNRARLSHRWSEEVGGKKPCFRFRRWIGEVECAMCVLMAQSKGSALVDFQSLSCQQ